MDSAPLRALALEGEWRAAFTGIQVHPLSVTIENRAITGSRGEESVSGDFRINGATVTAFIGVRHLRDGQVEEVLLHAQGRYQETELVLIGSTVAKSELVVRIVLTR